MEYKIFYSWQSDLPNNTNRGFIEEVIKKSLKEIKSTEEYSLIPTLDRDTKDVVGSPNIFDEIMKKIKVSDAFVADISLVTGNKESGQKLSPNPNVLLELGFAVGVLGWEKIILFFNEHYGDKKDLPFDLYQTRRIDYRLSHDDSKSELRDSLKSIFKPKVIKLLEKGKANTGVKRPEINVEWNQLEFIDSKQNNFDEITLTRIEDIIKIKNDIENEIKKVKSINGVLDLNWKDKVDEYIINANKYINAITNKNNEKKYMFSLNYNKIKLLAINISNDGNGSATDIRLSIQLPDWLIAIEKLPNEKDLLRKPNIPAVDVLSGFKNEISHLKLNDIRRIIEPNVDMSYLNGLTRNINNTSGNNIKYSEITYWADRLLHKHEINNSNNTFYLMAMPDAPIGKHNISVDVFCSEYDDWESRDLNINIK